MQYMRAPTNNLARHCVASLRLRGTAVAGKQMGFAGCCGCIDHASGIHLSSSPFQRAARCSFGKPPTCMARLPLVLFGAPGLSPARSQLV